MNKTENLLYPVTNSSTPEQRPKQSSAHAPADAWQSVAAAFSNNSSKLKAAEVPIDGGMEKISCEVHDKMEYQTANKTHEFQLCLAR